MKVQWSPLALAQAEDAMDFIAGQGRPGAAVAWLDGLFDRVRNLAPFPEQGRMVPEVGRPDIREVHYQGFRILYRISSDSIGVLSVRHSRQELRADEAED